MRPVWEKSSKFVNLLREQRKAELEHLKALKHSMKSISDKLASTLLECIIHDSRKHAALCKVLIDIEIGAVSPEMDVGNIIDISQAVEEHVEVEAEMIKSLESMLRQNLDDRTRELLNYMLSDERRHHTILKRMLERIS